MRMRRTIFLLSALFHVIVLYWIARVEVPLLVYHGGEKVINIIPISVPPLDILPSSAKQRTPPAQAPGKDKKDKGVTRQAGETAPVSPGLIIPGEQSRDEELIEKPKLTAPPPGMKTIPELSIYSENMQDFLRDFDRGRTVGRTGTGQGVGDSVVGNSGDAPTGQSRAFFNIRGYDLKPWAKQVLLRIQRNWLIPLTTKEKIQCPVEIITVIEKSGKISGITVKISSHSEVFNQAAVNALLLSSPLPGLPLDFPAKNLEALFMFTSSELQ